MQHRGRVIGVGSAATVILGGVPAALINELHGGWGWMIATAGVVLLAAGLTGWLAMRSTASSSSGDQLWAGAVKAARDIDGPVQTTTSGPLPEPGGTASSGDLLGPGAVKAGRDMRGGVTTHTTIVPDSSTPKSPEAS
jgi:hypothetical protein